MSDKYNKLQIKKIEQINNLSILVKEKINTLFNYEIDTININEFDIEENKWITEYNKKKLEKIYLLTENLKNKQINSILEKILEEQDKEIINANVLLESLQNQINTIHDDNEIDKKITQSIKSEDEAEQLYKTLFN
jgi:RecG-like helicase